MNEGQMIALEIVLDHELPIATELQLEAAVARSRAHACVLFQRRELLHM